MKPLSLCVGVDFNLSSLSSYPEREPAGIQCTLWVELFLHSLHDLGRRCVESKNVNALLDRRGAPFNRDRTVRFANRLFGLIDELDRGLIVDFFDVELQRTISDIKD